MIKKTIAIICVLSISIPMLLCPAFASDGPYTFDENVWELYRNSKLQQWIVTGELALLGGAATQIAIDSIITGTAAGTITGRLGNFLLNLKGEDIASLEDYYAAGYTDQDLMDALEEDTAGHNSYSNNTYYIPIMGSVSYTNHTGRTDDDNFVYVNTGINHSLVRAKTNYWFDTYPNFTSSSNEFTVESGTYKLTLNFDGYWISSTGNYNYQMRLETYNGSSWTSVGSSLSAYGGTNNTVNDNQINHKSSTQTIILSDQNTYRVRFIKPSSDTGLDFDHSRDVGFTCEDISLELQNAAINVSENTMYQRFGNYSGNYGVVGNNNNVSNVVNNVVIVNEADEEYTNPATGVTVALEGWEWNIGTNTYTLDLGSGNTAEVHFGDETVTITEGQDTYELTYMIPAVEVPTNYDPETGSTNGETPVMPSGNGGNNSGNGGNGSGENGNGGNGSGTGDNGSSGVWDRIGTLIGNIVSGITDFLGSILEAFLDALISLGEIIHDRLGSLIDMILEWFEEIPLLFGGFLAFLSAMFPFIPYELIMLIEFGLAAAIIVGLIKLVRK